MMDLKDALQDAKSRYERGEINEGDHKKLKTKILSEYSSPKGTSDAKVSRKASTGNYCHGILQFFHSSVEEMSLRCFKKNKYIFVQSCMKF